MQQNKKKFRRTVCVTGGIGFPFGTASTKRIQLIGRGLVECGMPFHVWHIGPSFCPDNKTAKGTYKRVAYEYLSLSVAFGRNKILRMLSYLYGCLLVVPKLAVSREKTLVYVYYQGSWIHLWVLVWCRLFQIPVLQEACEWWPETSEKNRLNTWLYEKVMFRWTAGALPISSHIEQLIERYMRPGYPTHRVPVLVDPVEADEAIEKHDTQDSVNHCKFLWCGSVYWFTRDIEFIIEACASVYEFHGLDIELVLCGPSSDSVEDRYRKHAEKMGFNPDRVTITGFLSDDELWRHCLSATAMLMPMWNDARSTTRFPTKMGQYIASKNPVITADVGEIPAFLHHEKTALFYQVGDASDLAAQMARVAKDKYLAKALAEKATAEVLPRLDYRNVMAELKKWIDQEL